MAPTGAFPPNKLAGLRLSARSSFVCHVPGPTRTRTNTNPNDTEANAAVRSVRACVARSARAALFLLSILYFYTVPIAPRKPLE